MTKFDVEIQCEEIYDNAMENEEARNEAFTYISDTFKYINGVRPHWSNYSKWTTDELYEECERLGRELQEEEDAKYHEQIKHETAVARAMTRIEFTIGDLVEI